jgi:hypothetical protein
VVIDSANEFLSQMLTRMKLKDITESSECWTTPLGTMDAHAPVADGVLVDLSLWGTSILGLAVQCPDAKLFRLDQSTE